MSVIESMKKSVENRVCKGQQMGIEGFLDSYQFSYSIG